MELGGAEMALIGLLNALSPEKVNVDLFIYSHQGPLMKFIPKWVNIIPEIKSYSMIERPMIEALRCGSLGVVSRRLMAKYAHHKYVKNTPISGDDSSALQFVADCVTPILPTINPSVTYDLCISFLTPHNIGRDKVKAHKRIAWIHTDYSIVNVNAEKELPVWQAYNHIASISPDVTRSFLRTFPTLKHKIIEIENILSPDFVRTRAEEFDASSEVKGPTKLLSIGRYCTAKNYDNLPDICRRIIKAGFPDLKWYIIGYGGDEMLIRTKIEESGMQNHVILLGKRDNPYPYIKACDIYVQPSRYEGKSITVREAQMLCKPVVVTNYPTAKSQVTDGIDGCIVPLDNQGCADGIIRFIRDNNLRQQITANLQTRDYGSISEVEKIYQLI